MKALQLLLLLAVLRTSSAASCTLGATCTGPSACTGKCPGGWIPNSGVPLKYGSGVCAGGVCRLLCATSGICRNTANTADVCVCPQASVYCNTGTRRCQSTPIDPNACTVGQFGCADGYNAGAGTGCNQPCPPGQIAGYPTGNSMGVCIQTFYRNSCQLLCAANGQCMTSSAATGGTPICACPTVTSFCNTATGYCQAAAPTNQCAIGQTGCATGTCNGPCASGTINDPSYTAPRKGVCIFNTNTCVLPCDRDGICTDLSGASICTCPYAANGVTLQVCMGAVAGSAKGVCKTV